MYIYMSRKFLLDRDSPRMLNTLHMFSNMCVFSYVVYYINAFIFFYGGTPTSTPIMGGESTVSPS